MLNACVTAARAGHGFLQAADRAHYASWEAGLGADGREILDAVRNARDHSVHNDGARIDSGRPFTRIPTPGDYKHAFHLEAEDGTTKVVPAVGACARYLAFLRSQLGAVA